VRLSAGLNLLVGKGNWNFDLEDCDHVLRVVSESVQPQEAIELLEEAGFQCGELEDLVHEFIFEA